METTNNSLLAPGTLLNGRYTIVSELSSGGFGNTYLANDTTMGGHRVAVKEFFLKGVALRDTTQPTVSVSNPDNQSTFDAQKEKFAKEAKVMAGLRHAHIVRVFDRFDAFGTHYYVMDYIKGESLGAKMKRVKQPLPELEVRSYLSQVLDALEYVHGMNILHLDIKPNNLMVEPNGNLMLIDFGACKQISPSAVTTTSTGLCYTPGYAPLEQMEQQKANIGPWTDIYSLGATLFKLLTNQEPPSSSDIAMNGQNAFKWNTNVSPQMRQLVMWMMGVSKRERPQNVEGIKMFLQNGAVNAAAHATPTPTPAAMPPRQPAQPATPAQTPQATIAAVGRQPQQNTPPQYAAHTPPQPEEDEEQHKSSKLWIWILAIGALLAIGIVAAYFLTRDNTSHPNINDMPDQQNTEVSGASSESSSSETSQSSEEEKQRQMEEQRQKREQELQQKAEQQRQAEEAAQMAVLSGYYSFSGNNGASVNGEITVSGNSVSGRQRYKSSYLSLTGSYDPNTGYMELYEYNDEGMQSGFYSGTVRNGRFSGYFTNYKGNSYNASLKFK